MARHLQILLEDFPGGGGGGEVAGGREEDEADREGKEKMKQELRDVRREAKEISRFGRGHPRNSNDF